MNTFTKLYIEKKPLGQWDLKVPYGPLYEGMDVWIETVTDNGTTTKKYRVDSTVLDIARFSENPDAEVQYSYRSVLKEA
jgi:hypothetical protein